MGYLPLVIPLLAAHLSNFCERKKQTWKSDGRTERQVNSGMLDIAAGCCSAVSWRKWWIIDWMGPTASTAAVSSNNTANNAAASLYFSQAKLCLIWI